MEQPINVNDWIKNKDIHLKIKDIVSLPPESTIKLLCYDRNFYDLMEANIDKPPEIPHKFFETSYIIVYKHKHDLHGEATFLNIDKLPFDFNFHLNYKGDNWYPLNDDGCLPPSDPQKIFDFGHSKLNYKDYPDDTRIGWRGPVILWSHVNEIKKFYYK